MVFRPPQRMFKLLSLVERAAALAQGKGYGAASTKQEVQLVHRLLDAPPKLAIDIGGNVGEYTAELRSRNSDVEIHVFEPSAVNIQKLKRRFRHDSLVRIVPVALSDSTGSATLYSNSPGSGLSSLSRRKLNHFAIEFDASEPVQVMRFEDYWRAELQSRPLNIVKIDIEGYEMAALKGFGAALERAKVVQFEFGGCNIDTRVYFRDFWYYFHERGASLYRITPLGLEKITRYKESDEFFSTTNYIAVNPG